jgi:D-alanyl-D-alanine carboxypeptidase
MTAVVVAAAVVMAACSSDGDSTSTTDTVTEATGEMSAEDQAAVDAAITAGVDRFTAGASDAAMPPGLWVGVWDSAKGVYLTAQGDAAAGQPATIEDHFRIGSTTKTFTATVILQLVDEGKLSLDDTVATLLPDLAAKHPEIADVTVESMLSMTSRIDDYLNVPDSVVAGVANDPTRVWQAEELIDVALEPGLLPEGTVKYSTTNSIIMQLIAESIEGKPLPELIDERLLTPLGMTESSLPIEDPSLPEPFTSAHLNAGCVAELTADGAVGVDTDTDPTDWTISYAQGGGGMTSTLADLGLWADTTSGNDFLGPELQKARLVADSEIQPGVPILYGLGIFQLGDSWYGHSGEAIGWQTLVIHNPDTGVSVVFAANSCNGLDLLFWSILNELYPEAPLDTFLTEQGF